MKLPLSIFWSSGFIIGLFILLLNDHVLKSTFHNFITGKLSDVAGLFIFPIFIGTFLPQFKKHIYWLTGIGFIFWKSTLSTTFIEVWNELGIFAVQRIIDYTDLFALAILPLSYWYVNRFKEYSCTINPTPVILIATTAFIATSKAPQQLKVDQTYTFNYSLDTLKHRIFFHPNLYNGLREEWFMRDSLESADTRYQHKDSIIKKNELMERYITLDNHSTLDTNYCSHGIWADMKISGNNKRSGMHISRLWHYCDQKKENSAKLLQIFERTVLPQLNK